MRIADALESSYSSKCFYLKCWQTITRESAPWLGSLKWGLLKFKVKTVWDAQNKLDCAMSTGWEKVPKLGLVMIHLCSRHCASDFLGSWWGTRSGMLRRTFPERHNWGRGPTLWEGRWDENGRKAADRQLSMGVPCPTSHQHWRKAAMMSQAYKTNHHQRNYRKLWVKKKKNSISSLAPVGWLVKWWEVPNTAAASWNI